MTEPIKLLPCPFDGGDGLYSKVEREGYDDYPDDPDRWAYFIQCRTCASTGPWTKTNREAAAWHWNRRADTLGAAWAEVEAALSDPWRLQLIQRRSGYDAQLATVQFGEGRFVDGVHKTPVDALRAMLAVILAGGSGDERG